MCLNEKNERNEENVCKGLGRMLGNVFNLLSCPEFCLCSKYEVMCSSFSGAGRWILFVFSTEPGELCRPLSSFYAMLS